MAQAIVAYLHFLSIFVLFALLTMEHVLFKSALEDVERARSLIRIDMAYGVSAVLVLLTGFARVLWYAKGVDYYLKNYLFHAKLSLFILVGLISILPTLTFLNWRNTLKAGQLPQVAPGRSRLVIMAIRLELLLLVIIPLLAVLMARGYGIIGG
ncbi:DUF2214 family protein [Zestomonas carbonaria]|uniref:DUF2214 family protein n=1 Tax=Zestomonas carbonaria TaxID=2762745 RepID=A0A7U7EN28_9GAMM|nr:DUF2214 family protein [Pseudomonas carbonaria]CAD5107668.1 hypothetical protein PSEWESI4_01942 [Pseudomonas carbonaria]